ncbi:hypothetical protein AABM08_13420, partial [Listeria ivanovii]
SKGENHGFILFLAKFEENWQSISDKEHIFIYTSDFEYLLDTIKIVYPLMDSHIGEVAEFFDVTGMNWIHSNA